MEPNYDGIDLFCRINVQSEMPHKEFVSFIARCVDGTSSMNAVRSQTLDISVDENDVFDAAKSRVGKDRWLYFRYTLEVDPVKGVPEPDYVKSIGSLLKLLWSFGLDAVASCEFEEQLPQYERRTTWAATLPRRGQTMISADWQKSLEALRNEFRDVSRSYPKLFFARLIGPIVSNEIWRGILGEKRYLRYDCQPISDDSFDQSCIYSASDSDEHMCNHGLSRFDALAEQAAKALSQIPEPVLGLLHFKLNERTPSTSLWLAFVDHLASWPGQPDAVKGFQRDQFKALRSSDKCGQFLLVPVIAHKESANEFPPVAFPHVWIALLSPDIAMCSASAIDELLRRIPDPAGDFYIATWIESDGSKTTWTLHDRDMLRALTAKYGEPIDLFEHEGQGVAGTNLVARLDSIPPGLDAAHEYHQCAAEIAKRLFTPDLTGMKIEQEINEGRKQIDICFDNVAERGFFHELRVAHEIKCPFIFVECKNYSSDPRNPELDQLQGRFGRQRGNFGMLLCRQVADPETLIRRCRDIVKEDKYIIVLTDSDIKTLWQLRSVQNDGGFHQYLRDKLKALIM